MLRLTTLLLLASISGNLYAFDKMTLLSSASIILDWGQTRAIADNPRRFAESNPLLGEHPKSGDVNRYFAAALVLNYIVGDVLLRNRPNMRKLYHFDVALVQGGTVIDNHNDGVRIQFNF